jgi:hypothetical protein
MSFLGRSIADIDEHVWDWPAEKTRDRVAMPLAGSYLTDGTSLFRVECILARTEDDALVELEDCTSLELIVCSARRIATLDMRLVHTAAGEPPQAVLPCC